LIVITLSIASKVIGSNIVNSFIGVAMDGAGITETRTQVIVNLVFNIWNYVCAVVGSFEMEKLGRKAMLHAVLIAMTFFLI
jgi:Ca2+/Na+ antiporter